MISILDYFKKSKKEGMKLKKKKQQPTASFRVLFSEWVWFAEVGVPRKEREKKKGWAWPSPLPARRSRSS